MTLLLAIGFGCLGVGAVVLLGGPAADVFGAVIVIAALVAIIRSVIRSAADAGAQSEPVSSGSGSSPEATSRSR
jgi:hypothetical protein